MAIRWPQIFFEQLKMNPKTRVLELKNTIGDELLKVHVSYGPLVQKLLKRFNSQLATRNSQLPLHAFAHITGGGSSTNPAVLRELRCHHPQRLMGHAADFQNHRAEERRAGC